MILTIIQPTILSQFKPCTLKMQYPPSSATRPTAAPQDAPESDTPEPSAISASGHASATTTGRSHPSVAETRSCTRRELKRIPRSFHQIALQVRICRRPHINVVRFRWLGFLPTRFRRLIKRQLREFPQQSRMRRDHVLFPRLIQISASICVHLRAISDLLSVCRPGSWRL